MKPKSLYFLLVLLGGLVTYESYAVAVAYKNLSVKFAPYSSVELNELGLSKPRLDMLVRIQDPSFYSHSGVEWPSPLTTTTITQSLVKRLFFEKFTKGFKKVEQTLIARFVVDPNIDKNTQIATFILTAYFGNKDGRQLFGFDQGARAWFNKSLPELSDDEYLSLIAMLPAPNSLKPHTPEARDRIQRIKKVLSGDCVHEHVSQIYLDQCM